MLRRVNLSEGHHVTQHLKNLSVDWKFVDVGCFLLREFVSFNVFIFARNMLVRLLQLSSQFILFFFKKEMKRNSGANTYKIWSCLCSSLYFHSAKTEYFHQLYHMLYLWPLNSIVWKKWFYGSVWVGMYSSLIFYIYFFFWWWREDPTNYLYNYLE